MLLQSCLMVTSDTGDIKPRAEAKPYNLWRMNTDSREWTKTVDDNEL